MYSYTHCPQPCSRLPLSHASAGDSWTLTGNSGSVSCEVNCSFLLGPGAHKLLSVPSRVYFPVLLSSDSAMVGNGDLLQEDLCHTQVCCTQSPGPCGSPLLTCIPTRDTQTQFCLSLCGVSGSWCAQGIFGSSECLWPVWGLILNMISPLLLSFWGFSFALGCGLSPQSHSSATQRCSSAYCLAGASLPLDVGYLLTATLASLPPHHHLLSFWASVPLDVGYFVGEKTKTQKDYILSNVTY